MIRSLLMDIMKSESKKEFWLGEFNGGWTAWKEAFTHTSIERHASKCCTTKPVFTWVK